MSKEIYISSTPHETRLAIVENDDLTEIYYERENEYTLAGSIYNGRVTRVLPGMQSSFVDIGLERDAFLYITDFMEEAGDSADFDSDGASRGGGRERQGDGARRTETGRPTESAEGGGNDRPDRGDRRDRRRSGGGERPGNRDRSLGAPAVEPRPAAELPADEVSFGAPNAGPGDRDELGAGSVGEGAPGADGSRRWRGRRGRRRGRGAGSPDLLPVEGGLTGEAGPPGNLANEPGTLYPAGNFDQTDALDILPAEAAGHFDLENESQITSSLEESSLEESGLSTVYGAAEIGQAGDREPRRGRGDRDRGRGRGGRDRDRRPSRDSSYSSRAPYGGDTAGDAGDPAAEPIVLPGETLAKYRPDSQQPASSSAPESVSPVRPSTEYSLTGAWDGGAVLPGETLRPRSGSMAASQSPSRPEPRSERQPERRSDRGRTEPAAPAMPEASQAEPTITLDESGVSVDPVASQRPEVAEVAHLGELPPSEILHESDPVAADRSPTEYEPEEGSASLRFDPNPPAEYRQGGSPVEEASSDRTEDLAAEPVVAPQTVSEAQVSEAQVSEPGAEADEPLPTQLSPAHSITPQPGTPLHMLQGAAGETTDHELTSVTAAGEMLSEPPVASPAQELSHPADPMEHETAILEHNRAASEPDGAVVLPAEAEGESEATSSDEPDGTYRFAPGDGALEEELMDEDEVDQPHVLAGSADDLTEEETLEGTADLATLIREMSIDQMTRPDDPGELEEGEVLEEEDAAYDEAYAQTYAQGDEEAEDLASGDVAISDDDRVPAELTDTSEASFGAVAHDSEPLGQPREGNEGRSGEGGRRGNRRDRDRGRNGDSDRANGGGGGDRGGRQGRRDGRHSMQATNLPAISDLLKPGQEVLVQIAKEPIAKKGARITSHIALPGRFLVFMPTVNHTGVSRKIDSDGERRRLKEILLSEKGEAAGGFIVRTAAAGATEEELRSDLRFLLNLWADIKQRSESSKSPALIYHDLNLVERILRDQVTDHFSAIWVDTETEYERVLRFLQRFQPSLIRRVKLYTKDTPLFEQFGIAEEINKALRSKVWLKSGGSIVINQTEALVAIDINTGKYVGKTARLEDTIVKTNLDAIPEIVRQIRLRDLGGIIIIDFIDMDERKNRNRVMAALEDELKKDRAPSKVLQFNDFGLVAITRKRVKQSLERTLSAPCEVCQGTGMTKSPVTVCNDIYIEMRKMQKHLDRGDVMLRVNPEVVKQLKSPGTKWLQEMEELVGKTILVKSDPALHPEQFDIH